MSNSWVNFAAIKEGVAIEQVLEHYRVRLKRVRKGYLRGLCPLPTHASEGAGRALAWTPAGTCGLVIRPPVIRHAMAKWREYSGLGGAYGSLLDSRGGVAAESLDGRAGGSQGFRSTGFKRKEGWP